MTVERKFANVFMASSASGNIRVTKTWDGPAAFSTADPRLKSLFTKVGWQTATQKRPVRWLEPARLSAMQPRCSERHPANNLLRISSGRIRVPAVPRPGHRKPPEGVRCRYRARRRPSIRALPLLLQPRRFLSRAPIALPSSRFRHRRGFEICRQSIFNNNRRGACNGAPMLCGAGGELPHELIHRILDGFASWSTKNLSLIQIPSQQQDEEAS